MLWSGVSAALITIAAYAVFYIAGFGLWSVAGYEIGIVLAGFMLWSSIYYRLRGYLIYNWKITTSAQSGPFFPETWMSYFNDNFPIQKKLIDKAASSYLFANDETFLLVSRIEDGNVIEYRVRSDEFIKERLKSLIS